MKRSSVPYPTGPSCPFPYIPFRSHGIYSATRGRLGASSSGEGDGCSCDVRSITLPISRPSQVASLRFGMWVILTLETSPGEGGIPSRCVCVCVIIKAL